MMIALLLLAQLSPWTPPGVVAPIEVASLIRAEDCGPSRCDWSPAIDRALALGSEAPSPLFSFRPPGGKILLPCGAGYTTRPIILRRGHTIEGCGGTFPNAGTLIEVRTTTAAAIIVAPTASGFALRHFYLATLLAPENDQRHAVKVRARGEVEEVSIRGPFVDGYNVICNHDAPDFNNCNGLKILGGRVDLVERHALYVRGQDAGACTFTSLDVGANCKRGSKWGYVVAETSGWTRLNGMLTLRLSSPAFLKAGRFVQIDSASLKIMAGVPALSVSPAPPAQTLTVSFTSAGPNMTVDEPGILRTPCSNVMDESMMGNTYNAIQTATAKDAVTGEVFRSIVFASPGARSVCIGCYAENDQGKGYVAAAAVAIGGASGWEGPGLRVEGRRVNGIKAVGMTAPGDTLAPEVWIGGNDWGPPGTVLTFMPPQGGTSNPTQGALRWRMSTTPGKRSWFADVANSAAAIAERISLEAGRFGVTTSKTSTAVNP